MDSNTTNNNDNDCPRFRPFACPNNTGQRMIKVKKAKYSTSLDPRGYIPGKKFNQCQIFFFVSKIILNYYTVYEYLVNGQPIMWDRESGTTNYTLYKNLSNIN
jgi:hypothetical protein